MGLLDDISMGLGLKDRDDKYYERTAETIANRQGAANAARYRSQTGLDRGQTVGSSGMPARGGLLSFLGAGSSGGSGSAPSANQAASDRPFLAQLFGYRDYNDMYDRGGPYASGGEFKGAGLYSTMGNIGHHLSGGDFEDFRYAPEVDAMIDQAQGAGVAEYLRTKEPDMYKTIGQSIIEKNFQGGFF